MYNFQGLLLLTIFKLNIQICFALGRYNVFLIAIVGLALELEVLRYAELCICFLQFMV